MNKNFWRATLIVTLIAAWLRFYDLTNYHGGLLLDEIWMALNARNLREGAAACCPLYFSLPFGGHPLFVYISWLAQLFFAPPFAGRILSATLGTLSVLFLIFVLRSLLRNAKSPILPEVEDFGFHSNWVGIIGGFTLATTVSHITFSRAGLETLLASVIAIPLIGLIYKTYETESWKWAILCGMVLGLSFYSYAPAAAFPIAVLAFAVWRFFTHHALRNTQYVTRNTTIKLTSIILLISFLCITPFLYTLFFTPNQYLSHLFGTTQATRSGNFVTQLLINSAQTIWGVSISALPNREYNFGDQPLFNPIVSIFFWLGFAVSLVKAWHKQAAHQLMIVWAICVSLPTLATDHAPHFGRWLQALPAFAFFVGVGVMWMWERLSLAVAQNNHNYSASLRGVFFATKQSHGATEIASQSALAMTNHLLSRSSRFGASLLLILCGGFTFYHSTATYFSVPLDKRDQMWGAPHRTNVEKMIQYTKDSLVFASPMNVP
ncbi:MAG: hypothetical protein HZB17_11165, partial [Chloroflexi bacterium]|nr:hypothetical protein [Chloroflexota bacterium]